MNLNFIGSLSTETSYGICSTSILVELAKLGINVAAWSIQPKNNITLSPEDVPYIHPMLGRQLFYDPDAPCVRLYHQFSLDLFAGRGKRVGFPIFELDKFADYELHHMRSIDQLIVASEWAANVCEANGLRRPDVVPLGVDRSIFNEQKRNISPDKTIFINVGKWEIRKGHDILISAFNKVFKKDDNVELWLLPDNPFIDDSDWKGMVGSSKLADKITVFPRHRTKQEVADTIGQADCMVLPFLAEGFCLPALEALSCGLDVIATNYSAPTEFLSSNNSMLIELDGLTEAFDGVWFKGGGGRWADFGARQMDQLCEYMRVCHKAKRMGNNSFNKSGIDTAKEFTWRRTAQKLMNTILGD